MAGTSLNTAARYVGSVSRQTCFLYPRFPLASSETELRNLGLVNEVGSQTLLLC